MKFSAFTNDTLARLSWLVEIDAKANEARLFHGAWVEVRDDFFIEGIWNGAFRDGQFDNTDAIFGSGGIAQAGRFTFVSSASTTDYLYYRRLDSVVLVSNSLAFLLAHSNDAMDPNFDAYDAGCESIANGIFEYLPEVPTQNGSVKRLIYDNLVVENGTIRIQAKPTCAPFSDYAGYVGHVSKNYALLAQNARDPARVRPLQILSTQSKGYDSTAVNALAAKFGIDLAFTVSKSKGRDAFAESDATSQADDDGSEIAAALGFKCVPIERRQFETSFDDEYLYFSGISNSEDLNFAGMSKHIEQPSILLTGTLGELYYSRSWYEDHYPGKVIGTELRRGDLGGGHGLTEVRLQTGFVQVPLIYLGAQQRASITDITESKEMDPWRLNTSYDRPIPRRMAEDAGVPRAAFGQKKMATTVTYAVPNIPNGPGLRKAFFEFLVNKRLLSKWQLSWFPLVHSYNAQVWFNSPKKNPWFYYFSRVVAKLRGKPPGLLWKHLNSSLYCFCVNRRIADYRAALAVNAAAASGNAAPRARVPVPGPAMDAN